MIQRRLLLIVLSAVGAAVAALVVAFNLILSHALDQNARSVLRARAAAHIELIAVSNGHVRLLEPPDTVSPDTGVWVFDGSRMIEHPRAHRSVDAAAEALARDAPGFRDVGGYDVRLYGRPLSAAGRRVGSIVVLLQLAPYEQTRRTALFSSLVFGGLILLLVAVAARWLLSSALRPVARMTRQAATWSERDLEKRFGLGEPRDELTELAATLDGLLDRLASSLRHEQRFSAELSHELRTPLARVIAETELALKRERDPDDYRRTIELVHGNAVQLARIVDALVAAAQLEATPSRGTADAYTVAAEAADVCAGLAAERGLAVQIDEPPQPIRLGIEPDFAERILQPVLENACRYGAHSVSIEIEREGAVVRYSVSDDGPGVDETEQERIFEPGVRGTAANGSGSGLGLSLARRLAETVAGEIEAIADPRGGRFVVRLPAG